VFEAIRLTGNFREVHLEKWALSKPDKIVSQFIALGICWSCRWADTKVR